MAKKNPQMSHDELCEKLALAYAAFLKALYAAPVPQDTLAQELYQCGTRHADCRGHFLSNAYLSLYDKFYTGAEWTFHSAASRKKGATLRFEHIVPKQKYIQSECEKAAQDGQPPDAGMISALLKKYWYVAVITAEEERRLARSSMPEGWDREDIFARYRAPKEGSEILLYRSDGSPCF